MTFLGIIVGIILLPIALLALIVIGSILIGILAPVLELMMDLLDGFFELLADIIESKTTVWVCLALCSLLVIPANLFTGTTLSIVFLVLSAINLLFGIGCLIYQLVSWG